MTTSVLGNHLKTLRLTRQLTQAQVAHQLFVSRKTVSTWETGRHQPDLQTVCQLADFYQITVDELLRPVPSKATKKTSARPVTFLGPALAIMIVGRLGYVARPEMLLLTDFVLGFLGGLLLSWWQQWLKPQVLHGLCVFLAAVLFSLAWQNLFAMAFGLQLVYMATAMTLLLPLIGASLQKLRRTFKTLR